MAKIRKATDTEKKQWCTAGYGNTSIRAMYPLFGFIKVKGVLGGTVGFWQCEVEYLGEGRNEPNYEIHAPKGMHFIEGTHTLLATTQADCFERLCGNTLVECNDSCDK